jgi:hypothetical protein
MRSKGLLVVAVALVVGMMLPVEAHHNDSEFRSKIAALREDVGNLKDRVRHLENLTVNLRPSGRYVGFVRASKVWSIDHCKPGDRASWKRTRIEGISKLTCPNP